MTSERPAELERAYETINQLEDLLGCALGYLEGDPGYVNGKPTIIADIRAYWEARKNRPADA